MAKFCVHCEKKIGMFATAIEGIYCSYECRDAVKRDIAENQRRAAERQVESARAEELAKQRAAQDAVKARADAAMRNSCPKCGANWRFTPRPAPDALDGGACDRCSFTAEFSAIEKCPTCTCMSLIVNKEGARCPRCKYRRA